METRSWKILLVEDDQDDYLLTRSLLRDALGSRFELDWASTYDEGLNTCRGSAYDVILVDYRLGAQDGLELVSELVARGCKTPMILMTGQGSYDIDLEAMKVGATDYLVKGEVTATLLERTIRYAIERKYTEEALLRAQNELEMRVQERTHELARLNQDLRQEIAERERAEQALRDSETRFRTLAETTSSAIFIVQDSRICYANTAARLITGYTPEELLDQPFWMIAHPAYQNILKQRGMGEAWAGQIPSRYELKLLKKTGEERWVDITAGGMDYLGRPALVVTAFDITERDQAEQELRRAKKELERRVAERTGELRQAAVEARARADELSTIFNAIADGVIVIDVAGEVVTLNPAAARALDWSAPASQVGPLGDQVSLFYPTGQPLPREKTPAARALSGETVISERYILEGLHGRRFMALFSASPLYLNGAISGAVIIWHDVTDLEQVLAQLEDERARLDAIIANAPEAIVVTDREGRILLANEAAGRLYEFAGEPSGREALSQDDLRLYYPDGGPYDPGDLPLRRSAQDGETCINQEMGLARPGGSLRNLLVSSAPIRDRHGEITGAVALFQDITERKQAEEEARQDAAQIELQHHLIGYREMERLHLAQDLHDGPLQELIGITFTLTDVIQMAAASLDAQVDGGTPLAPRLRQVQERLKQQIRELRLFCSELRPPTLIHFGLEKAIRSHAGLFQERNPAALLDLDLAADGQALPDQVRLSLFRIYQELVSNVARHSGATRVAVSFRISDGHAFLEIRDNGCGFDVPGDWVELARQGHLGLVGARERAEALGGSLAITSSPSQGTAIRVLAPLDSP